MRTPPSLRIPSRKSYATIVPKSMTQNVTNMKPTHTQLTASEPRSDSLHRVIINEVSHPIRSVRLVRLKPESSQKPFKASDLLSIALDTFFGIPTDVQNFLPGQWLDVHVPGIRQVGGFSITSTPYDAEGENAFIELAIQDAPKNPPAAWFWQPFDEINQKKIDVQVGGSFVWPPAGIDLESISKVVFVAGGVGINPLMSILSHLHQNPKLLPSKLDFLYTHRQPFTLLELEGATPTPIESTEPVLFLNRLQSLFASKPFPQGSYFRNSFKLTIFLTPLVDSEAREARHRPSEYQEEIAKHQANEQARIRSMGFHMESRRIADADLLNSVKELTEQERKGIVAYVCGPPSMTDWAVGTLRSIQGLVGERILCEKWW